jgi:P-type E1-E2 ATPase
VSRLFEIPGRPPLELDLLLLDVNGTLTNRGVLLPGVASRIAALRRELSVRLLSADTFGNVSEIARQLQVEHELAASAEDKVRALVRLGPGRIAAVGNGENDAGMLQAAALGIAVLGPEGLSAVALASADVVCATILDALDLLLDSRALAATLRS